MENSKILKRAIDALDLYLNAGSKEERKKASTIAKKIYEEYHGAPYENKINR